MIERLIKIFGWYLTIIGILILGLIIFAFFQLHGAHEDHTTKQGGLYGLILAILPLTTGVGLILKKNWARISLFVISIGTLLIGIATICGFIFSSPNKHVGIEKSGPEILFCFVFLFVIPVVFIFFFTRKTVKELYLQGRRVSKSPAGLTILAYYFILGFLGFIFSILKHLSVPFGPVILQGNAGIVYNVVLGILQIYTGLGLLKLKKDAWFIAIGYQIFCFVLGGINILMITESNMLLLIKNHSGASNLSLIQYKILGALFLLVPVIILIYLISKKDLFISLQTSNDSSLGVK